MARRIDPKTFEPLKEKECRYVKYNAATKTVEVIGQEPEGYDPLEDIIGGE